MHLFLLFIITLLCFFFFFFSSRRRHTRFDCDWSSDVCSSDLRRLQRSLLPNLQQRGRVKRRHNEALGELDASAARGFSSSNYVGFVNVGSPRSEEHTSELQSQSNLVCRLLLEKKNKKHNYLRW